MNLASLQRQFHAAVVGDEVMLDAGMEQGIAVYRNAYRARLVECLRDSYDRTWTWLGDEAFLAAACHHVILHPPRSWTLDDAGRHFDETLAALVPEHPEAADLAWLERAMQEAFAATNADAIPANEFAEMTEHYGEAEWAALRFDFAPGILTRVVVTDCVALWNAIESGEMDREWVLDQPQTVMVWRHGFSPQCRLLGEVEAGCLVRVRDGARFGDLCEHLVSELGSDVGIERAGTLLGQWLSDGLLVHRSSAPLRRSARPVKVQRPRTSPAR